MIRVRHQAGLAALVVLALATTSYAQNQQRGRGFGGGGFGGLTETALLGAEPVQKELKITDEQKGKLDAILRDARPGPNTFGGQNASKEDRQKAFEEFRKKAEEAGKKAKEVLTADQSKRLREVYIQLAGAEAIRNPDVAAALKITDDQKKQLATINEEMGAKSRDIGFGEGSREKREELRKETDTKVLAVLTTDQKKQLEEMKGAKTSIERGQLFQGRRPGGNNN